MLEHYYAKPSTIDRIRDSWLGSQIESYVGWMEANGYSSRTIFRRMPRLFSFAEFAHKRGCTDIASASSLVDEFVSEWPFADELGIPKLNFQVLRRTMATRAQNPGSVKDIPVSPASLASRHDSERVYAGTAESVQQMVGTVYEMLTSTAARQHAG